MFFFAKPVSTVAGTCPERNKSLSHIAQSRGNQRRKVRANRLLLILDCDTNWRQFHSLCAMAQSGESDEEQ
jgi:hypothetical protein